MKKICTPLASLVLSLFIGVSGYVSVFALDMVPFTANLTANGCVITEGSSTCNATGIAVTNQSASSYDLVNSTTGVVSTNAFYYGNGYKYVPYYFDTSTAAALKFGSNTLYARPSGSSGIAAQIVVSATCAAGTVWNTTKCSKEETKPSDVPTNLTMVGPSGTKPVYGAGYNTDQNLMPRNIAVAATNVVLKGVTLTWTAPVANTPVTSYNIYIQEPGKAERFLGAHFKSGASESRFFDGLPENVAFSVIVEAKYNSELPARAKIDDVIIQTAVTNTPLPTIKYPVTNASGFRVTSQNLVIGGVALAWNLPTTVPTNEAYRLGSYELYYTEHDAQGNAISEKFQTTLSPVNSYFLSPLKKDTKYSITLKGKSSSGNLVTIDTITGVILTSQGTGSVPNNYPTYSYSNFVHLKKNTRYTFSVKAYSSVDGTGAPLTVTTYNVDDIASTNSADRASWPQVISPNNLLQLSIGGNSLGMEGTTGLSISWLTPKGLSSVPGSYTISSVEYTGTTGQPKAEVIEKVVLATSGALTSTTVPAGTSKVVVVSPNGGESWVVGQTQTVKYLITDTVVNPNTPVLVYVERNGTMWRICKSDNNTGSCSYVVEQAMLSYFGGATSGFKIKVCAGATCSLNDSSDGVITITSGTAVPGNGGTPTAGSPFPGVIDASKYVLQVTQREVLIRGFVQSVNGDMITVKTYGGNWTARITGNTEYVSVNGRKPNISVGDYIGVRGTLSSSEDFTFTAAALRNRTLYP